ncbi:hypothetical protein [Shinella sp. M31]|uniref:hypothetical protein n=1 Tax=Shinella sp. M31 TaxID=3368615 RepID=UPI003B9DFA41
MQNAIETASKGDFAAIIGVSPGRISQYIADGKIFGDALVGEGRSARINVERARSQLGKTLDPSQRFGANGAAGKRTLAPSEGTATEGRSETTPFVDPVVDAVAAERLKQQRLTTARMEREEALAVGRYVLTEDARASQTKAVVEAFKVMEVAIQEMAKAIAANHGVTHRDAVLTLQKAFRDTREKQARQFADMAAALPAHIDEDNG